MAPQPGERRVSVRERVGEAFRRGGEGARPVGGGSGETHIAEARDPRVGFEAEAARMGGERLFGTDGADQRRTPPRERLRVARRRFEDAAVGALRRRRGARNDVAEGRGGGGSGGGASPADDSTGFPIGRRRGGALNAARRTPYRGRSHGERRGAR